MFEPTKESDSAPSNSKSIPIKRELGLLILMTEIERIKKEPGTIDNKQIESLAKQVLRDSQRGENRTLTELARAAKIVKKVPPDNFLHLLGLNYAEKDYDTPNLNIEQRMHFDLRRLLGRGYITTFEGTNRFTITHYGIKYAELTMTDSRERLNDLSLGLPQN